MKKTICLILLLSLMIPCLCGCWGSYKENQWYDQDTLSQYGIGQLPAPEGRDFVTNGTDTYVFMNSGEFRTYVQTLYDYLVSCNFLYFGTRGAQYNTLAGVFTTYYFTPADSWDACYVDGMYRFVFSDGAVDENGDVIFTILLVDTMDDATLQYTRRKKMTYNTRICLCRGSESALGGFYILPESETGIQ